MGYSTTSTALPNFVADWGSIARSDGRQIDWALIPDDMRSTPGQPAFTVTTTAQANAAATSIAVSALEYALPSGTVLDFTGTGEFARLSSAAAQGATSLAVDALDAQIESGDTAPVAAVTGSGVKTIPAGTAMRRDPTSKKLILRSGSAAATEVLLSDATEALGSDAQSGYGTALGGVLFEELMPDYTDAAWSTIKTELKAAGPFVFQHFDDDRA